MNKLKLLSIAVVALLVINLGTLSFLFFSRHNQRGPHHFKGEGPRAIIIERLEFDKNQEESYELLIKEHRRAKKDLAQTNRDLHEALFELLKDASIDTHQKDSLLTKITSNQRNMDELNFDHFQKIKSICRDNQLEKYNALVDELGELFSPQRPAH